MNRIRRLSDEVLEKHPGIFGCDFAENKKALNGVAVIRSKELKNEITGYITRLFTRERDRKLKEAAEEASEADREAAETAEAPEAAQAAEAPQEQPPA